MPPGFVLLNKLVSAAAPPNPFAAAAAAAALATAPKAGTLGAVALESFSIVCGGDSDRRGDVAELGGDCTRAGAVTFKVCCADGRLADPPVAQSASFVCG